MFTRSPLLNLALAVIFLAVSSFASMASVPVVAAASSASSQLPEAYRKLLPGGMIVPENLPSGISDPILLTGWVYLYNQQDALAVWGEKKLSGNAIAKAVVERKVSIQWNTKNECNGLSCTERPVCGLDSSCPAGEKDPGHVDIVIATRYQDRASLDVSRLAGTIAHEMIHYLMPFGGVEDSLYEEYWAFTVGAQIYKKSGLDFEGYNPLKESCLKIWFKSNDRDFYGYLKSYPPSVLPQADTKTKNCTLTQKMPGQTNGFPSGN